MSFGSKNRAMGVAGIRRSIIFNDLLFFWVGGKEKAEEEQGWEGRTRHKNKLCQVTQELTVCIQRLKLVRPDSALAMPEPEHISGTPARTTGFGEEIQGMYKVKKGEMTKLSPKLGANT